MHWGPPPGSSSVPWPNATDPPLQREIEPEPLDAKLPPSLPDSCPQEFNPEIAIEIHNPPKSHRPPPDWTT
jgi:hypothetical protein